MGIIKHIFRKLAITAVAAAAVIAAGVTAYAAEEVSINEENFPDAVFREYVLDNCDSDDSGTLSYKEISAVTRFNLYEMGISSLEGIKYFTELTFLNCSYNGLESLDVSGLAMLELIACNNNYISNLDLSGCLSLYDINCNYNPIVDLNASRCASLTDLPSELDMLENLDVSCCISLERLSCSGGSLRTLNLEGCSALVDLDCYDNELVSLNVSGCYNLESLICANNSLTKLDVSDCFKLESLECSHNELTKLDVSDCIRLRDLNCSDNALTSLDLSNNKWLVNLSCGNNTYTMPTNSLEILEKNGFDASKVKLWQGAEYDAETNTISCTDSTVRYLYNVSRHPSGEEFVLFTINIEPEYATDELVINERNFPSDAFRRYIIENFDTDNTGTLSEAEISEAVVIEVPEDVDTLEGIEYFTSLETLCCEVECSVTEIDLSGWDSLVDFEWNGGSLERLYLNDCHSLKHLDCRNNDLYYLDVSGCENLDKLDCSGNFLKNEPISWEYDSGVFNINGCDSLEVLDCSDNYLTELDLRENRELKDVDCSDNELTKLDLGDWRELKKLNCSDNHLTSLRVNENTKVWCKRNAYDLTTESLDELTEYGFEPARASNWQGAEYDEKTNSLVNITSDIVTYDYDAGADEPITFTLKLDIDKPAEDPDIPDQPVEPTEPDAPVITLATGDDSITVSWEDTGADLYRIRRNNGSGWVNYKDVTDTSFTDTEVESGTQYRYAVYAQVDGVWSKASNIVTGTIVATTEGFTVTATANGVLIEWDETEGAELYRIRRNDGSGWTNYKDLTETTYTDTDAVAGGKYYYAVYAKVDGTWSKVTEIVSIALKPEAPTGMSATETDGAVSLEWDAVAGATYRIRRNDGSGWVNYKDLSENAYVDTDVTAGSSYKYAVYACVNGMWSGASAVVSVSVS